MPWQKIATEMQQWSICSLSFSYVVPVDYSVVHLFSRKAKQLTYWTMQKRKRWNNDNTDRKKINIKLKIITSTQSWPWQKWWQKVIRQFADKRTPGQSSRGLDNWLTSQVSEIFLMENLKHNFELPASPSYTEYPEVSSQHIWHLGFLSCQSDDLEILSDSLWDLKIHLFSNIRNMSAFKVSPFHRTALCRLMKSLDR